MKLNGSSRLCALAALALFVASAQAGTVTTYIGADDGAPVTGPFPISAAAETLFLAGASAYGPVSTINFDSLTVGTYSPISAAPGVTITAAFGGPSCLFWGVCGGTNGSSNLYAFPISTPNYFAFAGGSATFTFSTPTNSFGFYATGLQTVFTTAVTVSFNDGTSQSLNFLPNVNGGAQYMGLTDTSSFSSITITDTSSDAWGIDNVSYNSASTTPEPSSLVLLGTGLLGAYGVARRRFSK
jgi:hypothetical protein